jgi:hypothetical protein
VVLGCDLGHSKNEMEELFQLRTMVTMGGDLQPGCLADRLLIGLNQPQIVIIAISIAYNKLRTRTQEEECRVYLGWYYSISLSRPKSNFLKCRHCIA